MFQGHLTKCHHAFVNSIKSSASNTKLIQNTVYDKPENKNDKSDTVKGTK